MHFDSLQYYVRKNKINELCRPVVKLQSLISNCTAAMSLSYYAIIITKQSTSSLSVTRDFDSSPASILHRYGDMAPPCLKR